MAKTPDAERKRMERQRKAEAGLHRVEIWVQCTCGAKPGYKGPHGRKCAISEAQFKARTTDSAAVSKDKK